VKEICEMMGISKPTLYAYVARLNLSHNPISTSPHERHHDGQKITRPNNGRPNPKASTTSIESLITAVHAAALFGRYALWRRPEAPKGFRPVSTTQAMMEYAAPLMAYVEDGTIADPNDALQVGLLLWNYTLPEVPVGHEAIAASDRRPNRDHATHGPGAAEAFCDEMIERKAYLFPDEMQADGVPYDDVHAQGGGVSHHAV